MRKRRMTCVVGLLGVLALPLLTRAQFQQPTPDELKMTEDPKAPDSPAVYLYREEVTDDFNHFWSFYERIKVLTEKGRDFATVRIPYEHGVDKVTDVQGRTIHSDGTVIPLTTKPSDLMDFKAKGFQVNTVVITLPSVEVGSILEIRLKVRSPDNRVSQPTWNIQVPVFVHKAHFNFHPSTGGNGVLNGEGKLQTRLLYSSHLPRDAKVDYDERKDLYSVDLTDIPAIPKDDWMPPLNSLRWRVEFYYTNALSAGEFWEDAGKHWARQAAEFTSPRGGLRAAAAGMVAPGDTEDQKARKIYAAVQKLDNTSFSRAKSEEERKEEKLRDIRNSEDVWKQQSGSANEIALLYIALARAAGLKVYAAQVVNRNRAIFDSRYLSTSQLDDYVAALVIDGKEIFLDPGQKMCPYGTVHWKHALASGFRQTDKDAAPFTSPGISYKAATQERVAQLFVDRSGGLTGSVRIIMTGPDALRWRQMMLENDADEVKRQFNESLKGEFPDGVQADFDHFLALDDYTVNLIGIVKVTGNIGTATGKRFFLPGLFFESHGKHPFVAEEKRETPIDVRYARTDEDDVTYHVPAGFAVESAPQAANASWPDHAMLKIVAATAADSVNVTRTLVYNFTLLDPKEYPNLHDFYQKVATADQQQLVLTVAATGKGN